VVVSDAGGTGGAPRFWYWRVTDVEAPPTLTTEVTDDGQQITGEFTLPDFIPDANLEVRAQKVTVDARVYERLDGSDSGLTCDVQSVLRWQNTEPSQSQTANWDIPAATITENALPMRWTFKLGDQGYGGGIRLRFSNVRGIAIDRVSVIYDEKDARP
jgi:hypothetical protein